MFNKRRTVDDMESHRGSSFQFVENENASDVRCQSDQAISGSITKTCRASLLRIPHDKADCSSTNS